MSSIPTGAERRQFGRRKTNLHGWIGVQGRPKLSCTVLDLSVGGALLQAPDQLDAPGDDPVSFAANMNATVEVIVAEPDRNRINAAFVAAVQSELASKGRGSKLELAGDTLQLTGGFILRASGLEIDCSLDAILAASQDELAPLVAEALLGR